MADGTFAVEVVTPEVKLLEGGARAVILRSSDGELTVLDGHTPIITDVVSGPVRVEQDEGVVVRMAVHGAFLQVETGPGLTGDGREETSGAAGTWSTRLTLLAGVAERAEHIDVARAERARAEAQAKIEELRSRQGTVRSAALAGEGEAAGVEDAELLMAEAALRRAEVRLEVAAGQ